MRNCRIRFKVFFSVCFMHKNIASVLKRACSRIVSSFLTCSNRTRILIMVSGICCLLLFVGGPDAFSSRTYKYSWDLGHILSFFIWSYLLLNSWEWISKQSFLIQSILVLSFALVLGVLIELIQINIGRTFNVVDVFNDFIGSLITLIFFNASRRNISKVILRLLQFTAVFLILLAIFPLARASVDEYFSTKKFPILSDFETPFEIGRWNNKDKLKINHDIVRNGKSSLRVQLSTTEYSGTSLKHFPNDWRDFSALQFSVFNTSFEPLRIHCKVYDMLHSVNGYTYDDRFNEEFMLTHGWNDIKIRIDIIANAPVKRKMDLSNIRSFGIFVVSLSQPKVIYIDDVRLVK
jgi:VanZ family protein